MSTRKYELLVVLPGTLNDTEAASRIGGVMETVTAVAEGVPEQHSLGKNRLAYPVKQIRYGYFYTVVFSSTPEKIKGLEEKMRLSRDILRAMVSHFNISLTAQQRLAYTNDAAGLASVTHRAPVVDSAAMVEKLMSDEPAKIHTESKVERKLEAANLEEISKKLDDLMSGDVIPTV